MFRIFYLFVCWIVLSLLFITIPVNAQEKISAESEYSRIREVAFKGDFSVAEADARKLVKAFPEYGDARILLGRILAWQKKYAEASAVIDTLLVTDPDNSDALSAKKTFHNGQTATPRFQQSLREVILLTILSSHTAGSGKFLIPEQRINLIGVKDLQA